ncbi:recombinase family protein [Microvirga aerophila]|uniref:recombinase family protein n=1 Tax=Microvirga aerophila TaxID=670291 RepID=UPI001AEC9D4E|nr:recombinase family protein [Microvirga aerophila]
MGLPRGYVLKPSGEVALDADEEVQEIIRLVFALFERRRSVSGVLRYLVNHDIRLPDRVCGVPHKGDVHWIRPSGRTLRDVLCNPLYAGAYVYGRRTYDGRLYQSGQPHSGKRLLRDPQSWRMPHRSARPAHIDWSALERNQEQIVANRTRRTGLPRCCSAG